MNPLNVIIEQNRRAVQQGVAKPGELVGTANTQPAELLHPWSVQPTVVSPDEGTACRYVVRNYETGFESRYTHATYEDAEREALLLQVKGEPL